MTAERGPGRAGAGGNTGQVPGRPRAAQAGLALSITEASARTSRPQASESVPWRLLLLLAVPAAIVLSLPVHAPPILVFVAACLGVLPLAGLWERQRNTSRRGPAPPWADFQRHLRQRGGADHRDRGAARRPGRAGEGLDHRQHPGQPAAHPRPGADRGRNRPQSELRFNRTNAGMSAGMLALAVVALVFPALFHSVHPEAPRVAELHLSEGVAVILHHHLRLLVALHAADAQTLFGGEPHPMAGRSGAPGRPSPSWPRPLSASPSSRRSWSMPPPRPPRRWASHQVPRPDHHPAHRQRRRACDGHRVCPEGPDRLGLQIALGSSTQIALLVAPLLVFVGVLLGQDMNLVFRPFEVVRSAWPRS